MNIMTLDDGNIMVSIPIDFRTVCGRRRCVVAGRGEVTDIDRDESNGLIKVFARAYEWTKLLETGVFKDITELAGGLKMDRPYVVKILRLANLSPRIFRAIVAKELPHGFTKEKLWQVKSDVWEDQERELGFAFEERE